MLDMVQVAGCVVITLVLLFAYRLGKVVGREEGWKAGRDQTKRAAWFREMSQDAEIVDLTQVKARR